MIQLKFYATRKGYYFNKYFTFNIKKQEEIGNILLPFALNHNSFNAIYVTDYVKSYTYKIELIEATAIIKRTALLRGIQLVSVTVSVLLSFVNL